MELIIKSEDFAALLRRARVGAFCGVTGVPIAKRFLFAEGHVYGSSGSVCTTIPFPQWNLPDASVDGALLEKAVRGFSGDLAITVDTVFKMRCGNASVSLPLQEPHREFYPEVGAEWTPVPSSFPAMVSACAFSNKTDYAGVALRHAGESSLLVGTDQSKIYYGFLPPEIPEFWLSVDAAAAVCSVSDEGEAIAADDTWVHIKFKDGTVFSALAMQVERYPIQDLYEYTQAFDNVEGSVCGEFTDEMRSAVKQASIFAGSAAGRKQVSFEYQQGKLEISSDGAGGSYHSALDWDGGGTDFAVSIDAQFILTAKPQQLRLSTVGDLTALKIPGEVNALLALDVL